MNIEWPIKEEGQGEEELFGEEARGRDKDERGAFERMREDLIFVGEIDISVIPQIDGTMEREPDSSSE